MNLKIFRLHESQKNGWRDRMMELNDKTSVVKDQLINIEVILMSELEV